MVRTREKCAFDSFTKRSGYFKLQCSSNMLTLCIYCHCKGNLKMQFSAIFSSSFPAMCWSEFHNPFPAFEVWGRQSNAKIMEYFYWKKEKEIVFLLDFFLSQCQWEYFPTFLRRKTDDDVDLTKILHRPTTHFVGSGLSYVGMLV